MPQTAPSFFSIVSTLIRKAKKGSATLPQSRPSRHVKKWESKLLKKEEAEEQKKVEEQEEEEEGKIRRSSKRINRRIMEARHPLTEDLLHDDISPNIIIRVDGIDWDGKNILVRWGWSDWFSATKECAYFVAS